jgi:hypothetical protein
VVVETDSVFALYSNVRCAQMYSILPHSLLALFEMQGKAGWRPAVSTIKHQQVARDFGLWPGGCFESMYAAT